MTRRTRLFFAAAGLALSSVSMSCAGPFNACVKPYSSQITFTGTVTELGEIVGIFLECDPAFSGGEAPICALESLNVLEGQLGPDGKAIVDCLVAYYETNGTAKQQAAAKAVGAKRGTHDHALNCTGARAALRPDAAAPVACAHSPAITNAQVDQAYQAVRDGKDADLVSEAGVLKWDSLTCVLNTLSVWHPELAPSVARFEDAHVWEIRAATLGLASPGDSTPPTGPTALSGSLSIPAFPVFETLASCPAGSIYGVVDGRSACLGEGPTGGVYLVGYVAPRWTPHISAAALERLPEAEVRDELTWRPALSTTTVRESVPAPVATGAASGDSASPAKPAFAYPGPNVGAALAHCDRICGEHLTSLATLGGECRCWRGKLKTAHGTGAWVAAR